MKSSSSSRGRWGCCFRRLAADLHRKLGYFRLTYTTELAEVVLCEEVQLAFLGPDFQLMKGSSLARRFHAFRSSYQEFQSLVSDLLESASRVSFSSRYSGRC